ncbi:hypothetical protein Tco_0462959 [Tanacetum coccineum]
MRTEMELTLEQTQQGVSYEVSVDPHGFEGYLKMEVKTSATLISYVLLEATRSRRHKFMRWQSLHDGETRLCLVDDLKVFKITFSHSSQDKGTSSHQKSMITTSNHKLMIEVKDYELKTKVKA